MIRSLTDADQETIRRYAERYVGYKNQHMAEAAEVGNK